MCLLLAQLDQSGNVEAILRFIAPVSGQARTFAATRWVEEEITPSHKHNFCPLPTGLLAKACECSIWLCLPKAGLALHPDTPCDCISSKAA
jgi:hypothetical protein